MAKSYKKVAAPRANPLGSTKRQAGFPRALTPPKMRPLKTRIYTKASLGEDPGLFGGYGFGDTGLNETPSIMGMGKNAI